MPVRIDRSLFDMVLMNFMTNALKYNRSQPARIFVGFQRQRRWFQLRVSDNGIGISKGELKRVFRKFYQIGQTEDMTAKGTGLGLYLVQLIARMHRGRAHAESKGQGSGTTFVLSLPHDQGE